MRRILCLTAGLGLAMLVLGPSAGWAAAPAAPAPAATSTWKHYLVKSPSSGKIERFWVGQAAGLKADAKYPVVYFLDGLLGTEDEWKGALEPLLGKYEMIAVCPSVGGGCWFLNSPRQPWMKWGDFLTDDLRAFVEAHYPASPQKGRRGICGISAGGNAALYHAITRPDLYGAVSVLSGAIELRGYAGQVGLDYWIGPRTPDVMPLYEERSALAIIPKQTAPLAFDLTLDSGDKDGALSQMSALRQALDARKIPYKWNVGQGGHDWAFWKSRTPDHLAWFAEAFASNAKSGRFPEKPASAGAAKLEVIQDLPDVALSGEALEQLRAAWTGQGDRPISVTGIPRDGAPLAANDPKYKEAKLAAPLEAHGMEKGLWLHGLAITVSTPLAKEGTITLGGRITNGRGQTVLAIPDTPLPVPAGEANRRVELRARLALEIEAPDALRGGMVLGLQLFDAGGKPVGNPVLAKARPGYVLLDFWPIAPQGRAELTLTLKGEKSLKLASVHDARLVNESAGK